MAKKTSTTPKTDLRGLTEADLQANLETLRKEIWQNRVKAREGALPQHHVLRLARRQIARIHTVLNEKRRAAAAAPGGR